MYLAVSCWRLPQEGLRSVEMGEEEMESLGDRCCERAERGDPSQRGTRGFRDLSFWSQRRGIGIWMEERTAGEGEHSGLGSWGPRRNDLSSTDKESVERGWVKVSYM